MKNSSFSLRLISLAAGIILLSGFMRIASFKYDFSNLKSKDYYKTLFDESELTKLSKADQLYQKGNEGILHAEKFFRKADGFKKVAQNFGGKTMRKAGRYEKKGVKNSLKAYKNYFQASDIKFHIYAEKLKNIDNDNSKRHLKAEEMSIDARSLYIEGSELKTQAQKQKGKAKVEALKAAFEKHLEAIHKQDIAFGIYMNDPEFEYDSRTDEVKEKNKSNTEQNSSKIADNESQNTSDFILEKKLNSYESKEEFITSKLDINEEDLSILSDVKDKKTYADNIMSNADNDYAGIEKIRREVESADNDYDKNMKIKMAEGLEDVLLDKILKAADLYFQANKTKYAIYAKYLPQSRNSKRIEEAKPYETNASKLHSDALKIYNKANFYSGNKSNKFVQIMNAVQTEEYAIQEQENAYSIYFDQNAEQNEALKKHGKTNDAVPPTELSLNYEGSFVYSKYAPTPSPLKKRSGIIFKVQAGLFKKLLPLKTYGKYSPISYDTFKNNPYKRFYLGEYKSYKAAEYVLNQIKKKGFTEAVIVAFENGHKKTSAYGIAKIVRDEAFEKEEAKEMSLLNEVNAHSHKTTSNYGNSTIKNITGTKGLIYCVQLGNFSSPRQEPDFKGVANLLMEETSSYKYFSGPFNTYKEAKYASNQLNENGYEGTFVTAYYNGKKISLQEAKTLQNETNQNIATITEKKQDIYFAVQIAAYSHKLNAKEMQQFEPLNKRYPISIKQIDRELFLYFIGHYNSYKEAASVKKQIKALDFDGFVIAFKNGLKISAADAIELLKNK